MQRHAVLIVVLASLLAMNANDAARAATTTTTGAHPLVPFLAAPYNLRRTTDKNECFSHGGGGYCPDPSQLRQPVLIWEYANPSSIDGYNFYKLTGGRHLDVQIPIRLNQRITWDAWTARPGMCFVVTAYKGAQESADSNKWCMPYVPVTAPAIQAH